MSAAAGASSAPGRPPTGQQFESVLRGLAARLDLPQPAKSRALLEIAGDLEDTYQHLRRQGLDAEESRRAALERFELSDVALRELAAIHTTRIRRLLDGLSNRGRGGFECVALGLLLLFVVALSWVQLSGTAFVAHVGVGAVPSVGLTLVALGIAAHKAWRVWLIQHYDVRRLRSGLAEVLGIAVTALAFGMIGFWLEIHGMTVELATAWAISPAAASTELVLGLRRAVATINAALLCSLLCCLLWWLLAGKVAAIERAETEYLMEL